jgi:DNA replication protein DnaC
MDDSKQLRSEVERRAADRAHAQRRASLLDTVAAMAQRQGVDMDKFNDPERADRLLAEAERNAHRERIQRQADILLSRLPSKYRNAEVPRTEWGALAMSWLNGFRAERAAGRPGCSLTIFGPTGTGKTWTACALARLLLTEDTLPVMITTSAELLDSLRPATGGLDVDLMQYALVPLLVLDDLGSEKLTEWGEEQLYRLAHERNHNDRPMIITSNLDGPAIRARYNDRLIERLFGGSRLITLPGESRRSIPF